LYVFGGDFWGHLRVVLGHGIYGKYMDFHIGVFRGYGIYGFPYWRAFADESLTIWFSDMEYMENIWKIPYVHTLWNMYICTYGIPHIYSAVHMSILPYVGIFHYCVR
jgi:hypothetical protein